MKMAKRDPFKASTLLASAMLMLLLLLIHWKVGTGLGRSSATWTGSYVGWSAGPRKPLDLEKKMEEDQAQLNNHDQEDHDFVRRPEGVPSPGVGN